MTSSNGPLPPSKRKHEATFLFTTEPGKLKVDEILDSSWCFKQQLQLEEGVTVSFKAGNSVSLLIIIKYTIIPYIYLFTIDCIMSTL